MVDSYPSLFFRGKCLPETPSCVLQALAAPPLQPEQPPRLISGICSLLAPGRSLFRKLKISDPALRCLTQQAPAKVQSKIWKRSIALLSSISGQVGYIQAPKTEGHKCSANFEIQVYLQE